jgi:hypothetical protein
MLQRSQSGTRLLSKDLLFLFSFFLLVLRSSFLVPRSWMTRIRMFKIQVLATISILWSRFLMVSSWHWLNIHGVGAVVIRQNMMHLCEWPIVGGVLLFYLIF